MMRLTAIFLLVFCLNICANGFAQKVSLVEKNAPLEKIFREITNQTGYLFVSTQALLQKAHPVTITVSNTPITEVLDICFRDQPLSYTIVDKMVVVVEKKEAIRKSNPVPATLPGVPVQGKITNEKGEPLAGATIMEKGTQNLTTSKEDGSFILRVTGNQSILVVSFVGYAEMEVKAGSRRKTPVVLSPAVQNMNVVVVIGYGTQKISDVTGAVARANIEPFRDAPNTNIAQYLQGNVPGLNVGQVHTAGEDPTIQIRGATTISGNNSPLVILDGVQFTGTLSELNPDDVATIDILKDASAAAVYGAQAANGIIIITSRKGRNNQKPGVSFSSSYAIQTPTVHLRPLNRREFLEKVRDLHYDEAFLGPDYTTPNPAFDLAGKVDFTMKDAEGTILPNDFNWWDEATNRGSIGDYQVSFSGGGEKVNYLISGGYTSQKGFIINDLFQRKTLRVNLETQAANWWKLGVQSFGSFNDYSGAEPEMRSIVRHAPLLLPEDSSGNLLPFPAQLRIFNPLITYDLEDYSRKNSFFANLFSEISVPRVKGLTYRINFGNNYRVEKNYGSSKYGGGLTGSAFKDDRDYYDHTFDNIVTYNRDISRHGLTATLLYGAIERKFNQTVAGATGFSSLALGYNSLQQGAIRSVNSNAWREALDYQMGRINYRFDNRYLLTATLRRDGFSGFAARSKFRWFPSLAVGWNINKESFFKTSVVNVLKLRASYGVNGNLTRRYSSLAAVSAGADYVFGEGGAPLFGRQVQSLANPGLRWEKTSGLNTGLDFTLFGNRLSGNLDYYNNTTNDLLFNVALPTITGFSTQTANVGNVKNKGIELGLTSTNIRSKGFEWNTTFNISRNTNRIVHLVGLDANEDGQEDDLVASRLFIGHSLHTIFHYKTDGIYQVGDDIPDGYYPGTFRIVDVVKDNVINPADRVILGREEPSFRFSVLNTFKYFGFTLRVFLNSIQGGKNGYLGSNFNNIGSFKDDNGIRLNYFSAIDYWSPRNPGAEYPRSLMAPAITPGVYKDRSFVRLQDVSLSYAFPGSMLKRAGVQSFSVYVSGKNLATRTKWKGWDPETGQGLIDTGRPVMKGYSAGVNLNF